MFLIRFKGQKKIFGWKKCTSWWAAEVSRSLSFTWMYINIHPRTHSWCECCKLTSNIGSSYSAVVFCKDKYNELNVASFDWINVKQPGMEKKTLPLCSVAWEKPDERKGKQKQHKHPRTAEGENKSIRVSLSSAPLPSHTDEIIILTTSRLSLVHPAAQTKSASTSVYIHI